MADFTTSDGLRIHNTDEGTGTPILCLSGLTRNSSDFSYVAPHLAGHRVIMMDYRGRGQSQWADDPMTYTIPREGMDAIELLDHLGIDKAAVLGTSRGGLIAMVLAATQKHRLLGIALNDIGPELGGGGLAAIVDYLGRNPTWKTMDEAKQKRASVMVGFANVPASRWAEEAAKHYVPTDTGLKINYDPRLRDAVLEGAKHPSPDMWPLFDAMAGLPLALFWGVNSDLLLPATVQKMREKRPDMIVAEVADRGHIPFLDEPEALVALRAWLEKLA